MAMLIASRPIKRVLATPLSNPFFIPIILNCQCLLTYALLKYENKRRIVCCIDNTAANCSGISIYICKVSRIIPLFYSFSLIHYLNN